MKAFLTHEIINLLFESYPKSLKEKELLMALSIFGSKRVKRELKGLADDCRIYRHQEGYMLTPDGYRILSGYFLDD